MAAKKTKKAPAKKTAKKKTTPERTPVTGRSLRAKELVASINSRVKGVRIQEGRKCQSSFLLRRPCGILSLDIATGGGLPQGFSQIVGPPAAGKNYLLNRYYATCQRNYGEESCITHAYTEFKMDKLYARDCGFLVALTESEVEETQDARAQRGLDPLSSEQCKELKRQIGTVMIANADTADLLFEALIDMIKSNDFQIIGVDSFGSMLTKVDDETPLGDDPQRARKANLETRFMTKIHSALNSPDMDDRPNETSLIGINQVRANQSGAGYREWKPTGSWSLRHGKLVEIQISDGKRLSHKLGQPAYGKEVNWELTKGKGGCHEGPKGTFVYRYDGGADLVRELAIAGIREGVIVRHGNSYEIECVSAEKLAGGKDGVVEFLQDHYDRGTGAFELIHEKVLRASGVVCRHV